MTFKDGHQMLMDKLDKAYQQLREIHADPVHLNPQSAECKQARDQFEDVQHDVWRLKDAWALF